MSNVQAEHGSRKVIANFPVSVVRPPNNCVAFFISMLMLLIVLKASEAWARYEPGISLC